MQCSSPIGQRVRGVDGAEAAPNRDYISRYVLTSTLVEAFTWHVITFQPHQDHSAFVRQYCERK